MKPLREQTLYEILEVPADAPEAEIVKAWDRVTALYGPGSLATYTLMAPGEAELLGRRLDEAISILLDPEARKRYDARITGTPAPVAGRGEDGTAQRLLPAATQRLLPPATERLLPSAMERLAPSAMEVRRRPPIIPPLVTEAAPVSAPAPARGAEPAGEPAIVLSSSVREETPIRLATPVPSGRPAPPAPPAPLATPPPVATAPAALATPPPVATAAAPLATPVPISPPFAAVAEAKPVATPRPGSLPAASPPPRFAQELVVPEGTRFSGDVLRRAREARGLTVAQICERTRITRHHIENLEAERHDKLPAPVYLRGILMALAKELRLDGQKVARSYLEAMQAGSAHGSKR